MKARELLHPRAPGPDADAVIREARRRQRKRRAAVALAVVVALATIGGVLASYQGRGNPASTHPGDRAASSPAGGPVLGGIAATLLMWPVGSLGFSGCGGPAAYLDDLSTRRLLLRNIPCIAGGDFAATILPVGRWVVYMTYHGASALPDDLAGRPRALGNATYIVPSASPGRVWLVTAGPPPTAAPNAAVAEVARSVSAADGQSGPAIMLPKGTSLIEGTQAGLLLGGQVNDAVELWTPGARPRPLTYFSNPDVWFAADAQLIAFGSGCRYAGNGAFTYQACRMLRVVNIVTGRRLSFPAPPGTLGWTPSGPNGVVDAISPANTMIVAQAAIRPARKATAELFILRLASARKRPAAVPQSAAPVTTLMTWSPSGSWLLYQGPGGRLRALRVATGKTVTFSVPCCRYEGTPYDAMFTVPGSP